jgi:hypothetical protein
MNKIGIAVPNLGAGHMTYCLIRNVNLWMHERFDTDITLFYETLALPCLPPNCAVMQIHEGFSYDGPMIATSLSTADKLARWPGPSRRLFYTWDMEWLRMPQKSFEQLRGIYANPDLELVARGQDHARLLEDVWNVKVRAVVEDFDLNELLKVINVHRTDAGISAS